MSLPHVLLGLLSDEPRTGYDLERTMREQVEPAWRAELSQIYPALSSLRRAGFVVLRVLGPKRGPGRRLYRATAAGRRELKRWIGQAPSVLRGKDEILARMAFLDALAPEDRGDAISQQEAAILEQISRLRAAPPLPRGSLREARRGCLEKLDATRRWLHGLTTEMTPPVTSSALRRLQGRKRK